MFHAKCKATCLLPERDLERIASVRLLHLNPQLLLMKRKAAFLKPRELWDNDWSKFTSIEHRCTNSELDVYTIRQKHDY